MARDLSEKQDALWWVAVAPGIWALHFLASYATVAVWCAKLAGASSSLLGARWAVGGYTLLALLGLAVVARRGYGQYRILPPDERMADAADAGDSAETRHHFLGFTLLALSALSAVAVLYEALAAVFIGSCR